MRAAYHPARVDCRCGCLGVQEYHEVGERVRRDMLVDRPAARCAPVAQGKITQRKGALEGWRIAEPVDLEAISAL